MATVLTALQAQQLAQNGDRFIFTNDASTGASLGAAHIPAAQAGNLEALLGYVPQNLTFSDGRVLAPDVNGGMQDITQYVDMNTYLPHDQTTQTSADSLFKTAGKFGLAGLGAYGAAAGLGALSSAVAPAAAAEAGGASNLINLGEAGTWTPEAAKAAWAVNPSTAAAWEAAAAGGGSLAALKEAGMVNELAQTPEYVKAPPGGTDVNGNPINEGPGAPPAPPPGGTTVAPVPTGTVPTGSVPTGSVPTTTGGNIDWGKVLAGIVGAVGSSEMAKQYRETADKYMQMGAPSRDRYEASFAPGFTMMNDPGYKDAMDSVGKESAAAMSMHGNPADSPNAWKQTQLDVYNKVAYPALQGYRQTNASAGGLASFASAVPAADTAATGAQQNIWNAGGSIASNLFSPPQTNSFDLNKFAKSMGWV